MPLPPGRLSDEHHGPISSGKESPDNLSQADVEQWFTAGIAASAQDRLDEAAEAFYRAKDLCRETENQAGLARAYEYLALFILFQRGEFTRCLTFANEAIRIQENQSILRWNPYLLRIRIYHILREREKLVHELDFIMSQVENDPSLAPLYFLTWATISLDDHDLSRAGEFLQLALRAANEQDSIQINYILYIEFSRFYRLQNQPQVALTWLDGVFKRSQRMSSYQIGFALFERALSRRQNQDFNGAYQDLIDVIKISQSLQAGYLLARALLLHAWWQHQDKLPQAAETWVQAARAISQGGYHFLLHQEQEIAFPLIATHLRNPSADIQAASEQAMEALSQFPAPPLQVQCLGHFIVTKGSKRIPDQAWSRRKAGELFRYLLLQPQYSASRDDVIDALWPNRPLDTLSNTLHQATSALRHALEPNLPDKFPSRYIQMDADMISLTLPPDSVIDFEQFAATFRSALLFGGSDRWKAAEQLYTGDLFPKDIFKEWSAEKREILQMSYKKTLVVLAQLNLDEKQYFTALNCGLHAIQLDAWDEEAVHILMQAYCAVGNVPNAIRVYRDLEKVLARDLQITPRKDLQDLAQQLSHR